MHPGHLKAKTQLREIEQVSGGVVEVLGEKANADGSYLYLDVAIGFEGIERVDTGLPILARERFLISVSSQFPYRAPSASTRHRRFAGFPHVQWGHSLCMYQSSADWDAEAGMYGFIARLDRWIRDGALDQLDPDEAPLHPPVAYTNLSSRLVVPTEDTPRVGSSTWIGYASLRERQNRTEIDGWAGIGETRPAQFAPAILLHEKLPFEYPTTVNALLEELRKHHIDYAPFIWSLAAVANETPTGAPLLVVLGTPMRRVEARGPLLQHLAVWEINSDDANKLRALGIASGDRPESERRVDAIATVVEWSLSARVGWCTVREMRPEVTRRRDHGSRMKWFGGKRVAIWGCGAIGSRVAEHVVRAGAAELQLVDYAKVTPGVLVRQGFEDADIGAPKAEALGKRLKRINPDATVVSFARNLLYVLDEDNSVGGVDIVLDCTASSTLRTKLEERLRRWTDRPAIASLGVGSDAATALATLSLAGHSGGPLDLTRRLKLEACRDPERLGSVIEAFWPTAARRETFQPEPGCSEPTFTGSDADLAGLSARMLNAIASFLSERLVETTAAAWIFDDTGVPLSSAWEPDLVLGDAGRGYSVRVSPTALRQMQAWGRRSRRLVGTEHETGGLAFGTLNEACGVLWVTEVEGPPPDSDASEGHFTCGIAGMAEAAAEKHKRYRGSVGCVGSWHTHPNSEAHPSKVDIGAVAQLLGTPDSTRRTYLLLIMSGDPDGAVLGAHAYRTELRDGQFRKTNINAADTREVRPRIKTERNIGLALSGGGSRAIAFHLGCFRALADLALLDRLQVISSVSGGSVLAAMYAYSDEAFDEFEQRVVAVLRRGLQASIAGRLFRPQALARVIASTVLNAASSLLRTFVGRLPDAIQPEALRRIPPRTRRFYSRSEAFRDALASTLFGSKLVGEVARRDLDVVINATELRTGSAFRFGSQQSGCWRFGTIPAEDALVADAVAASAAYPVLLPALDREYVFESRGSRRDRVLLTDGGVFENLGVSPMEPRRNASISTNVFRPDYILCCDAGPGLLDAEAFPRWWVTRMIRSFLTTFRKTQDATRNRLHRLKSAGEIEGFVHAYLGQLDERLPWVPPQLPTRSEVADYPTDFSAMSDDSIDMLSLRGEILTRTLLSHYLPNL